MRPTYRKVLPSLMAMVWGTQVLAGAPSDDGGVAGAEFGACCVDNVCTENVWSETCDQQGGRFAGDGVDCGPNGECIPTMSEWGVLILGISVAIAGCLRLRSQHSTPLAFAKS